MTRCTLTSMMLLGVLGFISIPTRADDAHWVNAAGGSFHDPNNWSWPEGDPRVPGPDDRALFSLGGVFTVTFSDDAASSWLGCNGGGDYTLDLGGFTYSVLRSTSTPFSVSAADLRLKNGILDAHISRGGIGHVGGTASLTIEDASLSLDHAILGAGTGGNGTAVVSGSGSSWTLGSYLTIGRNEGQGTLEIENGGSVSNDWSILGDNDGSTGTVAVTDADSSWTLAGRLTIGEGGSGSLTVSEGATVTAGSCRVASVSGSVGSLTVTGIGSTFEVMGTEGSHIGYADTGTLTVSDQGRWVGPGWLSVAQAGILRGDGAIESDLTSAGRIEPGSPTGSLTIDGEYIQYSSGTVVIDLDGRVAGESDQLVVTDAAYLNGTLELSLVGGYIPQIGDNFAIITAGEVIGMFDMYEGLDLGGDLLLYADYAPTVVTARVDRITELQVHPTEIVTSEGFRESASALTQLSLGDSFEVTGLAIWSSDDPSIASVSSEGEIRGETAGSTTIRAAFMGFEASAFVTVTGLPEAPATRRASLNSEEVEGNQASWPHSVALSGGNEYIAFYSDATNLVEGDTNGMSDVFVREMTTGITTRVSVNSAGNEIEDGWGCYYADLSSDGRYVAFYTDASNLVADDTNGRWDVFVHDRDADGNGIFDEAGGIGTTRVSVDSDGYQSQNGDSVYPAISSTGRFVAFCSNASDLVTGDDNGTYDVFVHDRDADSNGIYDEPGGISTTRISVSSEGIEGDGDALVSKISASGRFIAFESSATNLVPDDTNGAKDVFLHDRDVDEDGIFDQPGGIATIRMSVSSTGDEGDGQSGLGGISDDGHRVAFYSDATNLIGNDTNGYRDVFVNDRATGETRRVSVSSGGAEGANGGTGSVSISGDGRFVAFRADSDNLVPDDTNGVRDVFRHDMLTGKTERMSVSFFRGEANEASMWTALGPNGRIVVFGSDASNLAPFDTNQTTDVFVRYDVPGDIDGDTAVDLSDYEAFAECMAGPDATPTPMPPSSLHECLSAFDFDGDDDVDMRDYAGFQQAFGQ